VLETLKFLGFEDKNIFIRKDKKKSEMTILKCKMEGIFKKAQKTKKNVFFYFYYAGHGEIYGKSTSTQIVCSDGSRFSWEKELADLSNYIYTYILAFFDCCRVRTYPQALTRGPEVINAEPKRGNLKIIYTVKDGEAADANSKLAHCVLEEFKRHAEEFGGIKTFDHVALRLSLETISCRDDVYQLLHLPIPGFEFKPD
jgi:hypothetical protein